jgi:hypothetical protein
MGKKRREVNPGDRFNRLTFIEPTERLEKDKLHGLFDCSCGERIEVRIYAVISGQQKSCGCLKTEKLQARSTKITEKPKRLLKKDSGSYYVTDAMIGLIASPFDFSLTELNH